MKRTLLVVIVSIYLSVGLGLAQTGRGVIQGVVGDESQAVIPGADVALTHLGTNIPRTGITNEVGFYHFGALPWGDYQLVIRMPGFNEWTTTLHLQVGQTQVVDVRLKVGDLSYSVKVMGTQMVTNPTSMEVSDIKEYERIQQLPLNGRFISNLFELTPGVELEPVSRPGAARPSARVNGQKVGSLEITYDGVSMVDRFGGGFSRVQPALDTVQEFRIETVGSDARHSRPATVTLVSRSGSNLFHGSVFWKHRNNGFGLRARRREEQDDQAKLIRNEFGVTAGGPLYLGRLYDGRDKTFWFFSYEGLRERQSRLTLFPMVPTEEMWQGDLSNLVDENGHQWVIYDPLTTDGNGLRQPFPGNIIPSDRISAFGRTLATLTARPLNAANPMLGDNFLKFYPWKIDINTLTLKVDQVLSDRDNLSVRWTQAKRRFAQEGGFAGNPVDVSAGFGTMLGDVPVTNVAVNYTHTFSLDLLNELLVGVQRSNSHSGTFADDTEWSTELGLPNPWGAKGWPSLDAGAGWAYWDADNRKDQALTGVVLENNTTWVKGAHVIQFGGKFQREHNNIRTLQQTQGWSSFQGAWTGLYDPDAWSGRKDFTGHGFADVLLGLPDQMSVRYNRDFFYFRQNELGLYLMDKWKVSPNLTLNLGVRWDKWTPYEEAQDRLLAIDEATVFDRFEVVTPKDAEIRSLPNIPPTVLDSWSNRGMSYATARDVGYPENLFAADNNNVGLRLGVSYMYDRKTVLRGGYGEYSWPMPLGQILAISDRQPPLNLSFEEYFALSDGSGTWSLRNPPGPEHYTGSVTIDMGSGGAYPIYPTAQSGVLWEGRKWKDARSRAWHMTLERELMEETLLRITYTGNHARDLEQRFLLNSREAEYNYVARTGLAPPRSELKKDQLLRPNPDWDLQGINRTGYSHNHSGQVEIERRFSEGLGFQFFYTYTRCLSTSDAGGFSAGNSVWEFNNSSGSNYVPEWANLFQYENELEIPAATTRPSYDDLLKLAYFNSYNIPPHRIRFNGIADLPFGRGRRWGTDVSSTLDQIIGDWQVAFIGNWRSGFWRGVSATRFQFADPRLDPSARVKMTFGGQRQQLWFRGDFDPDLASGVTGGDLYALVPKDRSQRAIRPAGPDLGQHANQLPQQLATGETRWTNITELYNPDPRNFYLGPGGWSVDLSIFKSFYVTENLRLRLTVDFFNVFNHPIDPDPNANTGLVNLGLQINEPRIIQLGLRLDW